MEDLSLDSNAGQAHGAPAPSTTTTATTTTATNGRTNATCVGSPRQRRRIRFHPLLLEVAGNLDDPILKDLVGRLRKYRNRYNPILRLMCTLLTTRLCEAEVFGDTPGTEPIFTAPKWALSADKQFCIVNRLYPKGENGCSIEGGSPTTTMTHADSIINTFEDFMSFHFLPMALTHNFTTPAEEETSDKREQPTSPVAASGSCAATLPSLPSATTEEVPYFTAEDVENLIIREYVLEATRTSSFLIADRTSRQAVLIDPNQNTDTYVADLDQFSLSLHSILLTHCYVDIALGLDDLRRRFPQVQVLCGLPLQPAGTITEAPLSERVHLRLLAVPSFSPECVMVELHVRGVLVALFTGTAWSTDAAPRADLYHSFPVESPDLTHEVVPSTFTLTDAMETAQSSLKKFLYDRYLYPPASLAPPPPMRREWLERVVLFPSHGGYNNVTNQLDMYWAAHAGDFIRMRHSAVVLDTLKTADGYCKYNKKIPPLPRPPLFHSTRLHNLKAIHRALGPRATFTLTSAIPTARYSTTMIVDVRDAPAYHRAHLRGAVCVPMSFPAEAYGTKKAELWLQCLLLPQQPILAVCESRAHESVVRRRLQLISPGAPVEVYTLEDLLPLSTSVEGTSTEPSSSWTAAAALAAYTPSPRPVGVYTFSSDTPSAVRDGPHHLLPVKLLWVCNTRPLRRLDSYEKLVALEPAKDRMVLDVRTPYEFKNGSLQNSAFLQLSELCAVTAADAAMFDETMTQAHHPASEKAGPIGEVDWPCGPSPQLGAIVLEKMREAAHATKLEVQVDMAEVHDVAIYCAGGYRSIIALSLLQRAFEASELPWLRCSIELSDVAGGAFQIMTQRPDLWQVKDRSIICIS